MRPSTADVDTANMAHKYMRFTLNGEKYFLVLLCAIQLQVQEECFEVGGTINPVAT